MDNEKKLLPVPPGYRRVETDEDIKTLRALADERGDIGRVWLCDRALKGDQTARQMVQDMAIQCPTA